MVELVAVIAAVQLVVPEAHQDSLKELEDVVGKQKMLAEPLAQVRVSGVGGESGPVW